MIDNKFRHENQMSHADMHDKKMPNLFCMMWSIRWVLWSTHRLPHIVVLTCFALILSSCDSHAPEGTDVRTTTAAEFDYRIVVGKVDQKWRDHYQRDDFRGALSALQSGLQLSRKWNDRKVESRFLANLGVVYAKRGQDPKALDYYQRALAIMREIGDREDEGTILANIGELYSQLDQYAKAIEYYKEAVAIKREIGDRKGEWMILNNIGAVYNHVGHVDRNLDQYPYPVVESSYPLALEYYQQALTITRTLGDREGEGKILRNIGRVYLKEGQDSDALEYYQQALAINREIRDREGEGTILQEIGEQYSQLNQYSKALESYQQALAIKHEIRDREGEGTLLSNIGQLYSQLDQYSEARKYFQQALAIMREVGDREGEGMILNNLGALYSQTEEYPKALDSYEEALEITRENSILAKEVETNIGYLHLLQGEYAKVLAIFERIKRPTPLGWYYLKVEDYAKAHDFFSESLRKIREGVDSPHLPGPVDRLLTPLIGLGLASEGLADHDETRPVTKYWMMKKAHSNYQEAIALIEAQRDQFPRAQRHDFFQGKKVMGMFTRLTPYEGLTRIAVKQGQVGMGFHWSEHTKARILMEDLAAQGMEHAIRLPDDLAVQEDALDREVAAAYRMIQGTRIGNSIFRRVVGGTRGDSNQTLSQDHPTLGEVLREQVNREIPVSKQKPRKQGFSYFSPDSSIPVEGQGQSILKQGEAEWMALEGKKKAFIAELRQAHPQYAAIKYPKPIQIEDLQLAPHEVLIEYEVTDRSTLAWLVKGGEVLKTLQIPVDRKTLTERVKHYHSSFVDVTTAADLKQFDPKEGQALYELLLADLMPHLEPGDELVIVPDEILGILPFDTLPVEVPEQLRIVDGPYGPYHPDVPYLGERFPIRYYQSATTLMLNRTLRQGPSGERLALVVADPVFCKDDEMRLPHQSDAQDPANRSRRMRPMPPVSKDSETPKGEKRFDDCKTFKPLEKTGQLFESLRQSYGSEIVDGLTRSKASEVELRRHLQLADYRYQIYATHGVIERSNLPGINQPALVLNQVGVTSDAAAADGFLTLTDVMGLRMNTDLAALIACETGAGEELRGEGVQNMGRAFLYAGTRSVLMSLWSVEEGASVLLTERLFAHLHAGYDRISALRMAQEDLKNAGYGHPFFWAAFILVGERGEGKRWQPATAPVPTKNLRLTSTSTPSSPGSSSPLSRDEIAILQRLLNRQGYSAGIADGLMGRKTRQAIRTFQKGAGLAMDGRATRSLLERLNAP